MASTADPAAAVAKSKPSLKKVAAKSQSLRLKDIVSRTDHGQGVQSAPVRPLTPRQAPPTSSIQAAAINDEAVPQKATAAKNGDALVSPIGDSPKKTPIRRSKSPYAHVQSRSDHGQSKPKAILPLAEQADSNPPAASPTAKAKAPPPFPTTGRIGALRSALQQPVRSPLQQPLRSQNPPKEKSSMTGQRMPSTGPTTGNNTTNSTSREVPTEELEGAVSADGDADPQEVARLLLGVPTGTEASQDGDTKTWSDVTLEYPTQEVDTKLVATGAKQSSLQSASTDDRGLASASTDGRGVGACLSLESPEMDGVQPSTGTGMKVERTVADLQCENDRLAVEAQQQRMMIDALENQLRTTQGLQGVENSLGSESMHPDGGGQRREVELLHEAVAGMREQLQKARAQTSNLEQQCQVYQIRMEKLLRNDSASKSGGLTPGVPIPKIPLRTASQPQQRMEYVEVPNLGECDGTTLLGPPSMTQLREVSADRSARGFGTTYLTQPSSMHASYTSRVVPLSYSAAATPTAVPGYPIFMPGAAAPVFADPAANYYSTRMLVPTVVANVADGQTELSPRASTAMLTGTLTPGFPVSGAYTPRMASSAVTAVPLVRSATPRLARPVTPGAVRPAISTEANGQPVCVTETAYQDGRRRSSTSVPRLRPEQGRSLSPGRQLLGPWDAGPTAQWASGPSLHRSPSPRLMHPQQPSVAGALSSSHTVMYTRAEAPPAQERRFAHQPEKYADGRAIVRVDAGQDQTPAFMSVDRTEQDKGSTTPVFLN